MEDDSLVFGAKKKTNKETEPSEFYDHKKCIIQYKKYLNPILKNKNIDSKFNELFDITKSCKGDKELIRPLIWKIYLGYYKKDFDIKEIINVEINNRKNFKEKLVKYTNVKNFSTDPLGDNKSEWSSFFQDNEIKKLIIKDINRTYQERSLFKNNSIKEMLINILFAWTKENPSTGYWQGINEIVGLILMNIYPYYNKSFSQNNIDPFNQSDIEKFILKNIEEKDSFEELYNFSHNLEYIDTDIYFLFDSFMKKGMCNLYNKTPYLDLKSPLKDQLDKYIIENTGLESIQILKLIKDASSDFLKIRTEIIINIYLRSLSIKLYNHFKKVLLEYHIIFLRWIRCLFTREFHPIDCLKIIEVALLNEFIKPSELRFIDFFSLAMLIYIEEDLLSKDGHSCYMRLNKYPPIELIDYLIDFAMELIKKNDEKEMNKINNEIKTITSSKEDDSINSISKCQIKEDEKFEKDVKIENQNKNEDFEFLYSIFLKYNRVFDEKEYEKFVLLLKKLNNKP